MAKQSVIGKMTKYIGTIEWQDLSVANAEELKGFYEQVVGWQTQAVPMGGGAYQDFNMNLPGTGDTVAGVCHAKGYNEGLPAQWLIYVRVASLSDSIEQCEKLGGKLVWGPKEMGKDQFCVIQDPAGAVMALVARK